MLFSVGELTGLGVRPRRVVHCGAHVGQEAGLYRALRVADVLWVEANPVLVNELRRNVEWLGHTVVEACLGAG